MKLRNWDLKRLLNKVSFEIEGDHIAQRGGVFPLFIDSYYNSHTLESDTEIRLGDGKNMNWYDLTPYQWQLIENHYEKIVEDNSHCSCGRRKEYLSNTDCSDCLSAEYDYTTTV